ncbi:MAG: NADH-quinone oxidoreductase subunit L, partial [Verrucomicrobia bacterium]|nr:NADH-quinone oxidoreductase subunit L [Verrucomicrobiota bacterium]
MDFIPRNLWLIPALPLAAAGIGSLVGPGRRREAGILAVGAMAIAALLSLGALLWTLEAGHSGEPAYVHNVPWFEAGSLAISAGWILDPLSASMLLMITSVGTLIVLFSTGYMAHDERAHRFFTFLSFFAAAMLGLVMSNSLLLLFVCWELVGVASYLLIGFWFTRPAAAAAARKAFLTTRIGDLGLLLGMLWLSAETGTLLFFDAGRGCLESSALAGLSGMMTTTGLPVSAAIALLLLCGAVGKSGQVPLHVWLPDAMEGPTPVSALIHAATMVAAGVFLMARVFPLAALGGADGLPAVPQVALTWVGAITALFGALTAVAQYDIKRILAYSTVSQLGFMMMGLGAGGPAVGMMHLLTHAGFKALLFLGAGSVIHGCHHEQDIRNLGGLRTRMRVTYATYAVGMMALSGVPVFFSGFWSKDAILHALELRPGSHLPFLIALVTAGITAFYMTRQVIYVFAGAPRSPEAASAHESPPVMTLPLVVLAVTTVLLSMLVTPFAPVLERYLLSLLGKGALTGHAAWGILFLSGIVSLSGIALGAWVYRRVPAGRASDPDPLQGRFPRLFGVLERRFSVDEFYAATVVRWTHLA